MTSERTVICGCGWLGKYLASQLAPHYTLIGTTRHQDNFSTLRQLGVEPVQFSLGEKPDNLAAQAKSSNVVLNIPPGRRNTDLSDYTAAMFRLIDALKLADIEHLIFISTTSVYGSSEGVLTERAQLAPQTASGQAHVQIEHYIQKALPHRHTILRLAGLVGPDRHPVTTLSGRTLNNGGQPVNLVHVFDVVRAIHQCISNRVSTGPLHLCSHDHPTRKAYYTWSAQQAGMAPPVFTDENAEKGKVVDANKSWKELGLTPEFASPYDMMASKTTP